VVRVFGAQLPASSTKALVGHTLGAAGAMEAGFCWMMLERAREGQIALLPHVWDGRRDPALAPLRLVDKGERARLEGAVHLLTNSFGFGGNNCALVLGRKLSC